MSSLPRKLVIKRKYITVLTNIPLSSHSIRFFVASPFNNFSCVSLLIPFVDTSICLKRFLGKFLNGISLCFCFILLNNLFSALRKQGDDVSNVSGTSKALFNLVSLPK